MRSPCSPRASPPHHGQQPGAWPHRLGGNIYEVDQQQPATRTARRPKLGSQRCLKNDSTPTCPCMSHYDEPRIGLPRIQPYACRKLRPALSPHRHRRPPYYRASFQPLKMRSRMDEHRRRFHTRRPVPPKGRPKARGTKLRSAGVRTRRSPRRRSLRHRVHRRIPLFPTGKTAEKM